jgi:hypothetical protein
VLHIHQLARGSSTSGNLVSMVLVGEDKGVIMIKLFRHFLDPAVQIGTIVQVAGSMKLQ